MAANKNRNSSGNRNAMAQGHKPARKEGYDVNEEFSFVIFVIIALLALGFCKAVGLVDMGATTNKSADIVPYAQAGTSGQGAAGNSQQQAQGR